jgi:hypothetical protein
MWTYNYTPPNTLQHFGTLGMKWGVRRYQNKDGTLTKAGRRRQAEEDSEASKKVDIKSLSDDDLRKMLNRLQMERQLSQLLNDSSSQNSQTSGKSEKVSKGEGLSKQILKSSGKIIFSKIAAKYGEHLGDKLYDKLSEKSDKKKAKADVRKQNVQDSRASREQKRAKERADRLFKYYNPKVKEVKPPRSGSYKYLDNSPDWLI